MNRIRLFFGRIIWSTVVALFALLTFISGVVIGVLTLTKAVPGDSVTLWFVTISLFLLGSGLCSFAIYLAHAERNDSAYTPFPR